MASSFILTLDTTAPSNPLLTLNGGGAYISSAVGVSLALTTDDADTTGYLIKIYGDVADPGGAAGIRPNEVDASWLAYGSIHAVTVSAGDGFKTVRAKIRDDVGNETAELTAQVNLDTTGPVITITTPVDHPKISKVATFDRATFEWTADSNIAQWVVKVVPTAGATHDQGSYLANTNGSTNVNGGVRAGGNPCQVMITGADLQVAVGADGPYVIKVFAADAAGNWSV